MESDFNTNGAFLLLLLIPIIIGVLFVWLVSWRTRINPFITGIFYFAVTPYLILLVLKGYSGIDALPVIIITQAIGAILGVILGLPLHWLLLRSEKIPRWVGSACVFIVFIGYVFGTYPVRFAIIDKLGFGPSMADIVNIYDYRSNDKTVTLTIPRPYFPQLRDRYSASPAGSLSLCYPSMTPWAPNCENDNHNWKLDVNLLLQRKDDTTRPSSFDLQIHKNLERLSRLGTYSELSLPTNYPAGLKVFSPPMSSPDSGAGRTYYVPIAAGGSTFFYWCDRDTDKVRKTKNKWLALRQRGCLRVPLTDNPVAYYYFMPVSALEYWPEVEAKVARFITSLNPR